MNSFADIIGHEEIKRHLRGAITAGRVSHSYILEGAPGMGKKTLANAFAKALQCSAGQSGDSCGACVSCRVFDSSNHPDCIYVKPSGKKSIGVDDVREQINKKMETVPYGYPYKIFIVDEAETMTPAAQNALLKTIEEPSSYGVFIFLASNAGAFLPTVLSRCVLFKLRPLILSDVQKGLRVNGVSPEEVHFLSIYACGNLGHAIMLAESENFRRMRQEIVDMVLSLRHEDMEHVFSQYAILEKYKDNIQDVLDLLLLWYRDMIMINETGEPSFIMQTDKKDEIIREGFANPEDFYAVLAARDALRHNANFQLTMEIMLCRLSGIVRSN